MIHCTFENGAAALLRHITVGAIVVNDKKEVLLVKRAPHLTRPNTYTIPGGFLDRDETFKEGALRELKEETGLTGKNLTLFRINDKPQRPKEDRQNVDVLYIVESIDGEFQLNMEVTEIKWFSKDTLPSEEEFAFDHRESILKYFEFSQKKIPLPIVGFI